MIERFFSNHAWHVIKIAGRRFYVRKFSALFGPVPVGKFVLSRVAVTLKVVNKLWWSIVEFIGKLALTFYVVG